MATAPEQVRTGLLAVTAAAQAEVQAVAQAAPEDPAAWRATLFAAAPLIVSEYAPAAATLSLDWFEEIREEAAAPSIYVPTPRIRITEDDISAAVARATESLHEIERDLMDEVDRLMAESLAKVESELQKQVASGFWDTVVENAAEDPDATGWQRFAKPGACKFCVMTAARGAVYRASTARFAAHTDCHCVAGPAYDPDAPRADVMQYVAAQRKRTPRQRAALRAYLNENFPDAPG